LTLALDAGELSASRPFHFTPGKIDLSIHCIRGWMGHRAGLEHEKNL
jgi:hypothetical protein